MCAHTHTPRRIHACTPTLTRESIVRSGLPFCLGPSSLCAELAGFSQELWPVASRVEDRRSHEQKTSARNFRAATKRTEGLGFLQCEKRLLKLPSFITTIRHEGLKL